MLSVHRFLFVAAFASAVGAFACGSADSTPPVDEQCRATCNALATPDCRPHCTEKCHGACLAAPSDLHFEFAATTRVICAPDGSAVSFEIEREIPTLLACH